MLLRGILNGDTTTNIEPGSRKEALLKAILENGGGGGGLPDVTDADNGDFARVVNGAWDKDSGDDIARINGYYEDMTVGEAEQILSKVGVNNNEPYGFRPTGGNADVGNRKSIKKIVGGTVFFNQMFENGNFAASTGWQANRATLSVADNKATLTMPSNASTASYIQKQSSSSIFQTGRRYYVAATITPSADTSVKFYLGGNTTKIQKVEAGKRTRLSAVLEGALGSGGFILYVNSNNELGEGDTVIVENVIAVDLVAMFGTVVEASEFERLFPKEWYDKTNPTELSVNTTGHKTVGFNLLDSSHTAKLVGGLETQITGTYTALSFTTVNGTSETISPDEEGIFTPSANGVLTVTGIGDDTCVHLVWSGYRNDEYEDHVENTYPLDDDLTLYGVPALDASGKIYFKGDEYKPDGTVKRRYKKIVLDGVNNKIASGQVRHASNDKYYASFALTDLGVNTDKGGGLISDTFINKKAYSEGCAYIGSNGANLIMTSTDQDATTVSLWNGILRESPVTVVYELATPTEEESEPYAVNMTCDDFGTEEFIDSRAIPMPVGHETFYRANNADKLDHLPSPAAADGNYTIYQKNRKMTLKPIEAEIPALPAEDGTYLLKCTVDGESRILEWEAQS